MDKRELFYCCKTGNLSRIRYLVEEKDVDLNVIDKWDSTPLYYACLCGHYRVVLYLLQNGVSCDANTFNGERCLYGALTDDIRHLLENFKVITPVIMRRDKYAEFLRRTFEASEHSDVEYLINNEKFQAHRSIITSRSRCFNLNFSTVWKDKKLIDLTDLNVTPGTFKHLLQYLYMGQVCVNINEVEAFILIAKHFAMHYLVSEIKRVLSSSKKASVLYVKPNLLPQQDYLKLYLSAIPKQFRMEGEFEESQFVDLQIQVEDCVFSCHKVFICQRCSYLEALVTDHFSETSMSCDHDIQVITLHEIEPELFCKILKYIYVDTTDLSPENVLNILSYADLFMLCGLKKLCSSFVQEHLTTEDVIPILKVSRLYDLPRLENHCTEYMATHLEKVINQADFKELVLSDAKGIKNRQEIDTISVIDDIRYHIDSSPQVTEGFQKCLLINDLLEILKLNA